VFVGHNCKNEEFNELFCLLLAWIKLFEAENDDRVEKNLQVLERRGPKENLNNVSNKNNYIFSSTAILQY
jgi:hypothetical protein